MKISLLITSLLIGVVAWAQESGGPAPQIVPGQVIPLRPPAAAATNQPAVQGAPAQRTLPPFPVPGAGRPLRGQVPGTNAAPATTAPNPTVGSGIVPPGQLPPGAVNPGETVTAITPSTSAGAGSTQEDIIPAGMIKFPATDLNQVLKVYAELVGRTVLRPTTLPAPTITLETQTPLTRREAIAAFDAVLGLNGITAINIGDKFVKVVPSAQGGQVGAVIRDFNAKSPVDQIPDIGQFVTYIVQTTYVKPSELVQVLTPFASPGLANGILPIDPSQVLVLRDYSENVKRMLEMVKKIDVAVPSEFVSEVIPIKYALSSEIASALNSLSTGGGGTTVGGGGGTAGTGMAGSGMRGGGYGSRGGYGSSSQYGRGGYGMNSPYGGQYGGVTPYGTMTPAGGATTPGASGTFTDRLRNIIQKASTQGDFQVLGQTKIIADERTNSLLIFASREDMKMIKDIVSKLDVVLAQVLIEAAVIEVSLNKAQDLAVSYLQRSPQGGNYVQGIGAIDNRNILSRNTFNNVTGGTNGNGGILPQGFSYLLSLGNDLDISVTAFANDTRARILQRPRIQTSHAVPATLFVGESRPYPSGSYYGGGAFGGYSTIQQLPIGVSLDVTPLINPDGLVVMDIHQRIDSFKGNVTVQGVGDVPITSQKEASAKVAVRDHDTIMLGGLIENSKSSNNGGVPYLKDVPLIGPLFRSSSSDSTRSELIVLIRPTVLPTPEVAALTATAEQNKMPELKRLQEQERETRSKSARDAIQRSAN